MSLLAVAGADYEAVNGIELVFNHGDTQVCYTVSIIPDSVCEDTPNEQFHSDLAYVSGLQPTIDPSTAVVVIDDTEEPECSKYNLSCQTVSTYIIPSHGTEQAHMQLGCQWVLGHMCLFVFCVFRSAWFTCMLGLSISHSYSQIPKCFSSVLRIV